MFTEKNNLVQFGVAFLRVDMLNDIDGISNKLIINKKLSGREQDLLDAKKLQKKTIIFFIVNYQYLINTKL